MKKEFKTPQFLVDAIKELEEKEQLEWNNLMSKSNFVEKHYLNFAKDLQEIELALWSFKVKYGINLKIKIE